VVNSKAIFFLIASLFLFLGRTQAHSEPLNVWIVIVGDSLAGKNIVLMGLHMVVDGNRVFVPFPEMQAPTYGQNNQSLVFENPRDLNRQKCIDRPSSPSNKWLQLCANVTSMTSNSIVIDYSDSLAGDMGTFHERALANIGLERSGCHVIAVSINMYGVYTRGPNTGQRRVNPTTVRTTRCEYASHN
jgi:hypothetical protein